MHRGIHPWRRLRELAHVRLLWHEGGPPGWTDFEESTISLRRGLNQAERRSTVMHECLHVERGPVPMGLADREELRVEKESARLLLPDVKVIGEALAWARDLSEAADELWVDEQMLRVRLRYLHPAERGWLKQRLEEA
jgi:hypothetical protein